MSRISRSCSRPRPSASRREFLAGAGVAAMAAALGPQARSCRASAAKGKDADVIVVGGGFAGVVAARELSRAGLETLLLEGRDRLGGRTHTTTLGDHRIELGGTWVHWSQPHVWSEIMRYGLEIAETPGSAAPDQVVVRVEGKLHQGGLTELGVSLAALMRYMQESATVFPRPYDESFNATAVRSRDHLSAADRLESLKLAPLARTFVESYLATLCHNRLKEAAYVEPLRVFALCGNDPRRMNDALGRFKLRDGTSRLLAEISAESKATTQLSSEVVEIEQSAGRCVVRTAKGDELRARAIVVTLPLNVLGHVAFRPAMHAFKLAASREQHAGRGIKLYARLKQRVGNVLCLAGADEPICGLFTDHEDERGSVVVAFGADPAALDIKSVEQVQQATRNLLPEAEVVEVAGHAWTADPFARGTWCVLRPGQASKYLAELRRPEGAVFFASADHARGWRGFIDGAIERGLAVSADVRRYLAG